jgi:hypothetical protein
MRYKLKAVVNCSNENDVEEITMKGSIISYIIITYNNCRIGWI